MKTRWWILGGAGLYGIYKFLGFRQRVIDVTSQQIASKIRYHRELARKGSHESVQYLKSLDGILERLNRENSNAAVQILTELQFQGLYPASAI
jgi:hypothetical protein